MLENLLRHVTNIDVNKGYWFVRTDTGQYFENYRLNNFIGIGWNYITKQDIDNDLDNGHAIKLKIAREEELDLSTTQGRRKATSIYNKLKNFKELRHGDLIIIPSENSNQLAFGTISDDNLYNDFDNQCEHIKRRRVDWHKVSNFRELDPIFYAIVKSRHAISNIKHYESYIDKVISHLFIKDNYYHYVIDIITREDINLDSLINLITSINALSERINNEFDLNGNDDKAIKLNLQSPGKIEFKFLNGKSLVLLALLLSPNYSHEIQNNNDLSTQEKVKLNRIHEVNNNDLDTINNSLETLEAIRDNINSEF
jgi:predicted Mrr-cat superfamily restriction endonuclease